MGSSCRDLVKDMAKHMPILKNNQNTHYPRFSFTPKPGYSIPQNRVLVSLCLSLAPLGNTWGLAVRRFARLNNENMERKMSKMRPSMFTVRKRNSNSISWSWFEPLLSTAVRTQYNESVGAATVAPSSVRLLPRVWGSVVGGWGAVCRSGAVLPNGSLPPPRRISWWDRDRLAPTTCWQQSDDAWPALSILKVAFPRSKVHIQFLIRAESQRSGAQNLT